MATVGSMAVVLTASATDFERTMGRAARAVKSTEREFMQSARRMQDIGRKWTLGVTAPIVAGITAVSKAAIDWEDSFAGVRKSVDGTEEQLTQLDKSLRKMTETIPLAHKELANIAESAGQLGIQTDNIAEFVKTMAMLGSTTKMSADDAATGLAQIDNIMGTGQRSFDRYGSTVLALGNNLATTEQKIVDFTLKIAGAGKIAGLTEAQVMAISGAFGSVGVEAQAGGTAVSKALMGMTEAVATGDRRLAMFARTAGMSAAEFAQTWRTDAGEAFTRFVEGLGKSGDKAFGILRELGLSDQRLIRGFLSVANAGDLLRKSMDIGTKAWEENVVLVQKAQERYKTAASRLKMLGSRAKNVAISFGGALAPMIGAAMDKFEKFTEGLQRMADRFAELPEPVRKTTISLLLLLAAIGPVTYGIGLLNRTIAGAIGVWGTMVAFAGNAVFAFTSWRMGAATLGESLTYLAGGPVKLAILGIGAAVVATILLAANWEKFSAFAARVWSGVSAAVLYASSIIVRGVGMMITAISWIVPGLSGAAQAVMGLADGLKSSAAQALQSAQTTAQIAEQADKAASAADGAAKAQEGLAGALEMAEEAASGGLQSFDEVHQIQDQMSAADMFGDMDFPGLDIPEIPTIGDTFAEGIAKIGEVVTNVTETAVTAWEKLKTSIEPVNTAVEWIKDNWPTIGPIIEGIASALSVLLIPALIKSGIEAGIAGVKLVAAWTTSAIEAGISVGAQVAHIVALVAKWIWLGIEAGISAAKVVAAWVAQGLEAAASVGLQVVHFATIVGKWILLGATALIEAGKIAAAWVIAMGPVAWVIATIAAVAVAVALNWDEVKAVTERVWSGISTWLSDTWEGIKSLASSIWDGIKNVIGIAWDAIKGAAITVWDAIAGALKTAWDGIVLVATAVWDGLKSVIGIAWDAISLAATTAWEGIKTVLSAIWDGITFVATTVWDGIVSIVTGTWDAIKTVAGPAWEGIKTVLSVAWDAIAGVATTVWDGLVTGVSSAWDSISKDL
jgi:TP901 family phage tail tape measure protein